MKHSTLFEWLEWAIKSPYGRAALFTTLPVLGTWAFKASLVPDKTASTIIGKLGAAADPFELFIFVPLSLTLGFFNSIRDEIITVHETLRERILASEATIKGSAYQLSQLSKKISDLETSERAIVSADKGVDLRLIVAKEFERAEIPTPENDGEQWKSLTSMLSENNIEDAILSPRYLEYFQSATKAAAQGTIPRRVVLMRDRPRHEFLLQVFHQISQGAGITTAYFKKSEFYTVLERLKVEIGKITDPIVSYDHLKEILEGNPDIYFQNDIPTSAKSCTNGRLKYRAKNKKLVTVSDIAKFRSSEFAWDRNVSWIVFTLLDQAFEDPSRQEPVSAIGCYQNRWATDATFDKIRTGLQS